MASTLLANHLDQISLCAASISELEFPGPRRFTNALLAPHDITALIRDTELHERALFSLAPPQVPSKSQIQQFTSSIVGSTISAPRQHAVANTPRQPRRNTAVAAVLGGDLYRRVKNAGSVTGKTTSGRTREKGDLDVDILLQGAEKLCSVYPIPGAAERISSIRDRYQQLTANIAHYEDRVARNAKQLDMEQQRRGFEEEDVWDDDFDTEPSAPAVPSVPTMTKEDLQQEEHEIRDLERKKRGLEERVTGMEKDLGGLMR